MTDPTVLTGKGSGRAGDTWRKLRDDTDGLTLSNFAASHYGDAFLSVGAAAVTNLTLGPGTVDDVYRVVNMGQPTGTIDGFTVTDLECTNVERGVLRLHKASNGLVENCSADSGGKTCVDIPCGFAISDGPASTITFRGCTASGFVQNVPAGKYLNGDGFSTEELNDAITYEDCASHDNGDGGFDMKATNLAMLRCTASRNHRNFRLWGSGALTDCISEDPGQAHFWFGGEARVKTYELVRPVFRGGPDKPHIRIDAAPPGTVITITDPVLPDGESLRIEANGTGKQAVVHVVVTPQPALAVTVAGGCAVDGDPNLVTITSA